MFGLTGSIVVGADPGAPVTPGYDPPFEYSGAIYSATVDVVGDLIEDDEMQLRALLARQ